MKVKLGSTDSVPSCLVCAISAIAAVPSAMLTAIFLNVEHRVGLCVQAEENQFQHFL
jgi:hypothetical protein